MEKPRLLFLSHRLPFPPHNGAAIRTFNILKQLSEGFEIHALCFDRRDRYGSPMPMEERVGALAPYAAAEVFPIPQEHSLIRALLDHTRSLVSRRAYTYYVHESAAFERSLSNALRHRPFDLIHFDSLDLVRFVRSQNTVPAVCTHHNVESSLLRRRSKLETRPWRRWYLAHQADLLEAEERRFLPRFALNIAVSPDDAEALRDLGPESTVEVIPNGVDVEAFAPGAGGGTGCVFVGGTGWFPNRDALDWVVAELLPALRSQRPDLKITWVGRATAEEVQHLSTVRGLRLTGYVDDIRPYVQDAACYIAPLRVGGGTRLKLLDAWAMGKAVVSTTIGAEGLQARHGENILLADSAQEFVAMVLRVLDDRELAQRLGAAARLTAEEHYSWEGIGRRLRALYQGVLGRSSGG